MGLYARDDWFGAYDPLRDAYFSPVSYTGGIFYCTQNTITYMGIVSS